MLALIGLLIYFLLFPLPLWAALAVTDTTTYDQNADTDPLTWNHTTSAGANFLVVACSVSDGTATGSGATYNGVAMTEAFDTITNSRGLTFYYLANPDIGASQAVVVDLADPADGGCYSISFSGAAGTVSGVTSGSIGATTSASLNVTCPAGDIALDIGGHAATIETVTPGGSQTQIISADDGERVYWGSRRAGAGTTGMGWSWSTNSTNGFQAGLCVNAAAAAARHAAPMVFP